MARHFSNELGLSLSPPPVELREVAVSLLWHASYDRDPAHLCLRQTVDLARNPNKAGARRPCRSLRPRPLWPGRKPPPIIARRDRSGVRSARNHLSCRHNPSSIFWKNSSRLCHIASNFGRFRCGRQRWCLAHPKKGNPQCPSLPSLRSFAPSLGGLKR